MGKWDGKMGTGFSTTFCVWKKKKEKNLKQRKFRQGIAEDLYIFEENKIWKNSFAY